MSTNSAQKNWPEVKGKIKAKWGKFADSDIDSFKDNMNLIAAKVEKVYGITKDKAEQEYKDFTKSIETKLKN